MKHICKIFIALTVLIASHHLLAEDSVALKDIPVMASGPVWTVWGSREPVFNKNHQGNAVHIAGKKYDDALVGHMGMSLVYNLSANAKTFKGLVGIEDETPVKLKVEKGATCTSDLVILVDRKEVLRQPVTLGNIAVPFSVDLKGKMQLEIRAECGLDSRQFVLKRLTLADPVIVTDNKDKLLACAASWKALYDGELNKKLSYPPAPKWNGFVCSKVKIPGYDNAYKIDNGVLEMIVSPECGGKIFELKLKGGENVLQNKPELLKGKIPARGKMIYIGGFFTNPEPRNYNLAADPALAYGRYKIEFPVDGEIVLTSPDSWVFFLQSMIKIKLQPGSPQLQVETSYKNIADFNNLSGIWSLTAVENKLLDEILIPDNSEGIKNNPLYTRGRLDPVMKKENGWIAFRFTRDFFASLGKYEGVQWESYSVNNELHALIADTWFIKKTESQVFPVSDMGGFYPLHFYLGKRTCELEFHSPLKNLKPGEKVSFVEYWHLKKK